MRYDQPVTFVKEGVPVRQPDGNYVRSKPIEQDYLAHISSVGLETQQRLYGEFTESALTLRLLREPTGPFDHVVIDGKIYKVDSSSRSRNKALYMLREVK